MSAHRWGFSVLPQFGDLPMKSFLGIGFVLLAGSLLLAGGQRASERSDDTKGKKHNPPATQTQDVLILKLDDKLTKDNPKDRVRNASFCQVRKVNFEAGKTYQIDLVSNQFDAFLRLEDGQGKQLATDDDGGSGSNARIVYQATTTGDN